MKTVYIETTIPSYLTAEMSSDIFILGHQKLTLDWWKNYSHDFELYSSQIVIDEIKKGDTEQAQKRLEL